MLDTTAEVSRREGLTRRSFLRDSGLFAAAVGLSIATSGSLLAQEDTNAKKDEPNPPATDVPAVTDAPPETKLDSRGIEYRDCPECGAKMYKENRTWLCEACGYSYEE